MTTVDDNLAPRTRAIIAAYAAVAALVLALMMVFGLLMSLSQAELLTLPPNLFYQVLTAHGIGMVGIASLAGATILWYFLSQYVRLSTGILIANLVLFLSGVVLILGAIFVGGFAGMWTFLYPLPAQSAGVWSTGAATVYLVGVLVVGVGLLLLFLDIARAIISKYGNLGRGLGWPQLFGGSNDDAPPPTVVASTMAAIINILALLVGATVFVLGSISFIVVPESGAAGTYPATRSRVPPWPASACWYLG